MTEGMVVDLQIENRRNEGQSANLPQVDEANAGTSQTAHIVPSHVHTGFSASYNLRIPREPAVYTLSDLYPVHTTTAAEIRKKRVGGRRCLPTL